MIHVQIRAGCESGRACVYSSHSHNVVRAYSVFLNVELCACSEDSNVLSFLNAEHAHTSFDDLANFVKTAVRT